MTWRDLLPTLKCAMTAAAAKAKRRSRPKAPSSRAAARLVRPPSPPAAVAAAGGRAGRSVPGLAVGNHAAADQRRRRSAPYFEKFLGALAGCRRARPGARTTTCCGCGPGSATIRARATFTPARWPCCATMAGVFPDTEEGLARTAGHRAVHGGGDRRDRLRPSATMPVDGNIERVVARLYAVEEPLPQAKPRDPATRRRRSGAGRRRRRLRAGADGSRRHDLHAEEAGLRAVPAERGLRRARARRRRRRFRARRRRRRARCGAARPSWSTRGRRAAGAHAAAEKACSAA